MLEKLKEFIKGNFSNRPKAKNMILVVVIVLLMFATAVTITSMRKTLVLSIDGKEETFVTYKGTVKDVLQEKGIELSDKDKVQPSLETKVYEKAAIKVKKAMPVEIESNGIKLEVQTAENNIADMLKAESANLKEKGIEFDGEDDEVAPSLDSSIEPNLKVQVVKVEKKDVVAKEDIQFDIVVEHDDNLDKSIEEVKSEGSNGQKEVTYQVVYKNGVEASRTLKTSKVISEPKSKVVVKGSGTLFVSRGSDSDINGKVLGCEATAYSGGWGTASGMKPRRVEGGISTIAVDPSFIPMGTKVYVEGYGYAIAADTGTAIKGNKIDLYFNSYKESCDWGLKKVKVTIISYPGQ